MKKDMRLLLGAVGILFLVGVYFLLDEEEDKSPSLETSERVEIEAVNRLVHYEFSEILTLEIINYEETMLMEKTGDSFTVNDNSVNRLDREAAYQLFWTLAQMSEPEIVGQYVEGDDQWGFDKENRKVVFSSSEGTFTLYPGGSNPSGTGVYVIVEGRSDVFMASQNLIWPLTARIDDLRNRQIATFDPNQVKSFSIHNGFEMDVIPYERTDLFKAPLYFYMFHKPYNNSVVLATSTVNEFLASYSNGLYIQEYIDEGTADDYGLGDDTARFTVEENSGRTFTLRTGLEKDGSVYALLPEENQIVLLHRASLSFLEKRPFDFVDPFPLLIKLDDLAEMEVSSGDWKVTGSVEGQGDNRSYAIDGRSVDSTVFQEFYQALMYLLREGESEKLVAESEPVLSISYKLLGGSHLSSRIDFLPYDKDFYAISENGADPIFTIGRYQIDQLQTKIQDIKDSAQ